MDKENLEVVETCVGDKEEEKLEKKRQLEYKDAKISLIKSGVVKSQILKAYKILDSIKLDSNITDTDFRDKISDAKNNLASAASDFLLDETYWRKTLKDLQVKVFG